MIQEIQIHNNIYNKVYHSLLDDTTRRKILYGGRDSGKSDFIACQGVEACITQDYFLGLLIRKQGNKIQESCYKKIQQVIYRWGLENEFIFLTRPLEIRLKSNPNARFIGVGMDDPMKAKSITDPTWAWYEEADQLTYYDYSTTTKGLRGPAGIPIQEWFSFNAGSPKTWIVREFFPAIQSFERQDGLFTEIRSPYPNTRIVHTCHLHNEFITDERLIEYQILKDKKPDEYNKDGLGLFQASVEGQIFTNWDVIDFMPEGEPIYGIDFGYNDPMALTKIIIHEKDAYIDCLYYEREKTIPDLLANFSGWGISRLTRGYCDSARPGDIQQIYNAGFVMFKPAVKGAGSIVSGINHLLTFNLHITSRSVELIEELNNYRWDIDKAGELMEGVPIDAFNHAIDAMRYAIYTHTYKPAIKSNIKQQPSPYFKKRIR